MGADLYINRLYEPHHQKWEREFDRANKRCDGLKPDTKEYQQAQAEVGDVLKRRHGLGYFRDPYNDSDLLWKFGLSWWNDIIPMLDADSNLSPAQAKRLLSILKDNQIFEMNLRTLSPDERKYYLDRYAEFQRFLSRAIELGEPIQASL